MLMHLCCEHGFILLFVSSVAVLPQSPAPNDADHSHYQQDENDGHYSE